MSRGLADVCRKQGFPVGDGNDVANVVIRSVVDDSICGKRDGPDLYLKTADE